MNSWIKTVLAAVFLIAGMHAVQAAGEGSPAGLWLTEKGDARIHVTQCGSALCGKVVWLRDPIDPETGKPQADSKNPNPALATRPMIGIHLFIGMNPAGPGRWAGRIYNADDGGTYNSKIALTGPATLRVEGCLGAICGGENWTKVGSR